MSEFSSFMRGTFESKARQERKKSKMREREKVLFF